MTYPQPDTVPNEQRPRLLTSGHLLGWWEMLHHIRFFEGIRSMAHDYLAAAKDRAAGVFAHTRDPQQSIVAGFFGQYWKDLRDNKMLHTEALVARTILYIPRNSSPAGPPPGSYWWKVDQTYDTAVHRLEQFIENLDLDVSLLRMYVVANDKVAIYEAKASAEIATAFPSAIPDLDEANKCFALERYTATVFHLMKAVEYPMRDLATALGVRRIRPCLEQEDWSTVITQIKTQSDTKILNVLSGVEKKDQRSRARQFFNPTIADLWAFKDDVRNVVMHAGSTKYDEPGALNVRNRVLVFLERLALRVSEGGPKLTKSTFRS
jgi:hypothetical protein